MEAGLCSRAIAAERGRHAERVPTRGVAGIDAQRLLEMTLRLRCAGAAATPFVCARRRGVADAHDGARPRAIHRRHARPARSVLDIAEHARPTPLPLIRQVVADQVAAQRADAAPYEGPAHATRRCTDRRASDAAEDRSRQTFVHPARG